MKRILLSLVLGPCLWLPAHAEFKDGNKLLTQIKGDSHDYVNAVGYITGVADALRSVVHCPPENVTAGQLTDMVKRHLENSPEVRHMTGDTHISYVLKRAWPCPDRGTRPSGSPGRGT